MLCKSKTSWLDQMYDITCGLINSHLNTRSSCLSEKMASSRSYSDCRVSSLRGSAGEYSSMKK